MKYEQNPKIRGEIGSLVTDLIGILMLIAEKVSLNSQVSGGSFSLKIYTMERDLYKQIKLKTSKKRNLNLKQ